MLVKRVNFSSATTPFMCQSAVEVELENLLKEQEYNFWRENTESSEESANADLENGYNFTPESSTSSTNNSSQNKDKTTTKTKRPYRNPLRKIANGGVLQYPIDLDTDLQDYFEIQIFRYRAAGGLPGIKQGNQGHILCPIDFLPPLIYPIHYANLCGS